MNDVMPAIRRGTAGLLYFAAFVVTAFGQQPPPAHASVDLLAKQNAVVPGSGLALGVHFVLEPGWHIYWTNPGDSGQPPVLQWRLPPGFQAGEIEWPRPERMQTGAQLADYGYYGEVLLPVSVHVPQSAAIGSAVRLVVEAKWLVCREVCIPEHGQLHLSLTVAAKAREDTKSAALFAHAEKLLPQPVPRGWEVTATSGKDEFVLSVRAGKPLKRAEFFPLEPNEIDNPAPQKLLTVSGGVKIVLKKSDLLTKPIAVLRGVLVVGDGPAYRIEAPVLQPIK
jgi:DsbC/DsbD-like thiol-disulfide interchange protein